MFLVRSNFNRNVVCSFSRGNKVTHFLGVDGGQLTVLQEQNDRFDALYYHVPLKNNEEYTALQFALAYTRTESARKMIPISPSASRVLTAIIRGQMPEGDDESATTLEVLMAQAAKEDTGFRKPEGNVAQVHKFLDQRIDSIKAGTISRKELVEKLVEKGIPEGTATTQAGVWARTNSIAFVRPSAAKEAKAASKSKKRASAKKATPAS